MRTFPDRGKVKRIFLSVVVLFASVVSAPAAWASDGVDAYRLADHKSSVAYGAVVTMWDCWDPAGAPRFSAWNGARWVLWDVGAKSVDSKRCPSGDMKIVYTYTVSLKGRPSTASSFNLLKVKEHCTGCETSAWTLQVVVP